MTKKNAGYLTILFVTKPLLATNSRGENAGNLQTLQEISVDGRAHTIVSGYALRYASRLALELLGYVTWRHPFTSESNSGYGYGPNFEPAMLDAVPDSRWDYPDTALFGYMIAGKSGKAKEKAKEKGRKKGGEGEAIKERAAVGFSGALSLSPFRNDTAFVRGLKEDGATNPFMQQRHFTRYQFLVTFDLNMLLAGGETAADAVRGLLAVLPCLQVGGNHAANASEFTVAAMAWRFHRTPGQGGLGLGFNLQDESSSELSTETLDRTCLDRGITVSKAGLEISNTPIADALESIWDQIETVFGIADKKPLKGLLEAA